jgi:hypothetical protein
MPIQTEPPRKRMSRPQIVADTGPLSVLPQHGETLEELGQELKRHQERPDRQEGLRNRQVGLRNLHGLGSVDDGVPEELPGVPGQAHTEQKTHREASHVEDDMGPALDEVGQEHHPDVAALAKRVGKPHEGEHGHEIARVLVGDIQGAVEKAPENDLADGDDEGYSHQNPRHPAADSGEVVDQVDQLFHIASHCADWNTGYK